MGGVAGTLSGQGFFSGTPTDTDFTLNGGNTTVFTNAFGGVATGSSGTGGPFSSTSPYSITEEVTVTIGAALANSTDKTFQLSGNVSTVPAAVPEPASVSLLGGVLLLTAGAIRRKIRRA